MSVVRRGHLPWLMALPLMGGGVAAAHWAGAVIGGGGTGLAVEESATHRFLEVLPLWVGLLLALGVVGSSARALRWRRPSRGVTPKVFVLLPPVAFLLVEAVERLARVESYPFDPGLEPGLLVGLALQAPFGALAYLVARFLLRAGRRLGQALRAVGLSKPAAADTVELLVPEDVLLVRATPLSLGYAERGPPGRFLPV